MLSYRALRVSMGQLWIMLSTICRRPLDLLDWSPGPKGKTYGFLLAAAVRDRDVRQSKPVDRQAKQRRWLPGSTGASVVLTQHHTRHVARNR